MTYNLSVVNIVEDQYKDKINYIAELFGCGPNNLSVKLIDNEQKIFWGCHSWWKPTDYAAFMDIDFRTSFLSAYCTEEEVQDLNEVISYLYSREELDGNPIDSWHVALSEVSVGLKPYEETEG